MKQRVSIISVMLGVLLLVSATYFYENHDNSAPLVSTSVARVVSIVNSIEDNSSDGFKEQGFHINEDNSILGVLLLSMLLNLSGSIGLFALRGRDNLRSYASIITLGFGGGWTCRLLFVFD